MNIFEIEEEINKTKDRLKAMEKDLSEFGTTLSAPSQFAIILRIANAHDQMKEFEAMKDVLAFEEITKNF